MTTALPAEQLRTAYDNLMTTCRYGAPLTFGELTRHDARFIEHVPSDTAGYGIIIGQTMTLDNPSHDGPLLVVALLTIVNLSDTALYAMVRLDWTSANGQEHAATGSCHITPEALRELMQRPPVGPTVDDGPDLDDMSGGDFSDWLSDITDRSMNSDDDEERQIRQDMELVGAAWSHILPDTDRKTLMHHRDVIAAAMQANPRLLCLLLPFDDLGGGQEDLMHMLGGFDPQDLVAISQLVSDELSQSNR